MTMNSRSALQLPNQHEKNKWSRMATAAYSIGLNSIGHTYSVAASLPRDGTLTTERFDELQRGYRAWLIGGFDRSGVIEVTTAHEMLARIGHDA